MAGLEKLKSQENQANDFSTVSEPKDIFIISPQNKNAYSNNISNEFDLNQVAQFTDQSANNNQNPLFIAQIEEEKCGNSPISTDRKIIVSSRNTEKAKCIRPQQSICDMEIQGECQFDENQGICVQCNNECKIL